MFKVGDRVRIRDWDDMVKEYGLNSFGSINGPKDVFSKSMKRVCGKLCVISSIEGREVVLQDFDGEPIDSLYSFYTWMLESEENEPLKKTTVTIDKCGMTISQGDVEWLKENKEKREEKDMNKVLELYCEKAEKTIEKDFNEMIEEEREENPFVKEYNDLVKEFEAKMDDLYKREMDENGKHHVFVNRCNPTFYQFDIDYTFTNENIVLYKDCKKAALQDLEEFKQEVSAKLSLSDDLDYTLKVLKEYGIIDKKTGKLESYFTELDEQNEV